MIVGGNSLEQNTWDLTLSSNGGGCRIGEGKPDTPMKERVDKNTSAEGRVP